MLMRESDTKLKAVNPQARHPIELLCLRDDANHYFLLLNNFRPTGDQYV